ncbi:hypothetical protein CPB86DRAFT_350995 [Serendipita vermifera]|nr:hypothetical protein CPB86DRAFT_350995 [Serendipita vermifera]
MLKSVNINALQEVPQFKRQLKAPSNSTAVGGQIGTPQTWASYLQKNEWDTFFHHFGADRQPRYGYGKITLLSGEVKRTIRQSERINQMGFILKRDWNISVSPMTQWTVRCVHFGWVPHGVSRPTSGNPQPSSRSLPPQKKRHGFAWLSAPEQTRRARPLSLRNLVERRSGCLQQVTKRYLTGSQFDIYQP